MPTKPLPSNANIDHLKYQAKDVLTGLAARDPQVAQRIREFHPRLNKATDAVIFDAKLKAERCATRDCPRVWLSELGETQQAHRETDYGR